MTSARVSKACGAALVAFLAISAEARAELVAPTGVSPELAG